ncbi:MAG: calcium-binding protein, partial [Pseudomonadota bacterium]
DDSLIGDDGNDTLTGGAGADTLNAGIGNDRVRGSLGNDLFVFQEPDGSTFGFGNDTIADFVAGAGTDDVIDISTFERISNFDRLLPFISINTAGDAVITLGLGSTITLNGVAPNDLHADDFFFG